MKTMKKITIISLLSLLNCSSVRPPVSSLGAADNPPLPRLHLSEFNSILDASPGRLHDSAVLLNLPEGSRIIPIREGGISPVNGVVFNTVAAAGLETEIRAQQQVCLVNSFYERQRLAATAVRDIESLTNTLTSQQRSYQVIITNRNNTIREYERYSSDLTTRANGEVGRIIGFTIGGIVLGAVTTGLIVGFFPRGN